MKYCIGVSAAVGTVLVVSASIVRGGGLIDGGLVLLIGD